MIDSSVLLDNLVAVFRDIPELVALVGGDATRIFAYHDQYPKRVSLVHALHAAPAPSIMAAWQGTTPGTFGAFDVWKHQIGLFLRAPETDGPDTTAYYRMFRQIVKGVPASQGVAMSVVTVHPNCYPMDLPSIVRQTDAEGLDYFEVQIYFTEIGDE